MKRLTGGLVVVACSLLAGTWSSSVSTAGGGFSPLEPEAQATGPASDYRYERYVRPAGPGPNRLPIDLPLLTGGRPFSVASRMAEGGETTQVAQGGLADLRLFDENRREVPYLLVPPSPRGRVWSAGRVLPIAPTKKTSGFEVDLGGAQPVDRLLLDGLPAPYLKRARLEGSGDRAHWTLLVGETTVFDLPDDQLTREEIEFPAGEFRYLRVTWDDASSARLPLPRAARARKAAAGQAPPPLHAPLAFERTASEPGVSRYRITSPAPNLPIVAIELSVGGGYVLRRARVVESRLSGGEMVPVPLGSAVLRRALREGLAASDLRVPVSPPRESQFELVVQDDNNPPLDLAGISAIFAELPWIYFEAERGQAILARFGSPKAEAPRYDLEAVRPSLPRLPIADATWGERLDLAPGTAVAEASAVPTVGAPIDAAAFTRHRPIPPGPRGLTALRLDAAALAHSRFSDLRIATPDRRQVAYLVERLDEPLALQLPLPKPPDEGSRTTAPSVRNGLPPAEGARTTYRITLPYAGLPVSRLAVDTAARVFSRRVRVLVERPDPAARDGRRFDVVGESAWGHTEPETAAPPLALDLPPLSRAEIWLVVDEGDNSPLPLARLRLLLPAYRLRFFRETDQPLSLLYGNPDLAAPRYDLALIAPRLVGASAHEVSPGPETGPGDAQDRTAVATALFWGALVAAVLVLVVLLARLLRT
jgi:hypothetical protein